MPNTPHSPAHDGDLRTLAGRTRLAVGFPPLAGAVGALLALALLADPPVAAWAGTVPPAWLGLARLVSALGNSNYMLAGSALVAAAAWWRGGTTGRGPRRARLVRVADRALFFFAAIAASGLAAQLAKHVIGRVRPQAADALGAYALHPFSLGNGFAGFPSGHTTSAFAAATALSLMIPRARFALFALAVAIGAARVVLREHYPSDIVGGAALGLVVALALATAPAASHAIPALQAWMTRRRTRTRVVGPGGWPGLARPLISLGTLLARHNAVPVLAAGVFAVAVPPTDLFGSELLEHAKDGCAVLVALAGLTVRALVVGFGQRPARAAGPGAPPTLMTDGAYAVCRHPLHAGTILIVGGLLLMHGNRWTVLLGTATCVLLHHLMVQAEEDQLRRTFGTAYEAYSRQVPRWLPGLDRLRGAVAGPRPFDLRRVLPAEYKVIGMTIVGLTAAEFYEEIQEPWAASQVLYLQGLATIILGASLAMGLVWLAQRRRMLDSP